MNRPNVILILTDDLGWRDLGCYGSTFYETPNLDRLAAEGMRFTDAYAACPVCSPTRASILTGKYPARVGITDWIDWGGKIHPARGALIDAPYLKSPALRARPRWHSGSRPSGYATWHVGKWHLGGEGHLPHQHGLRRQRRRLRPREPGPAATSAPGPSRLSRTRRARGNYLTDHLTDEAIELIRRPRRALLPEPLALRRAHADPGPRAARGEVPGQGPAPGPRQGATPSRRASPSPAEHKKTRRIMRRLFQSDPVYAAMVENLDGTSGGCSRRWTRRAGRQHARDLHLRQRRAGHRRGLAHAATARWPRAKAGCTTAARASR